ncbi:MAG: Nramp family divalent metal transporter [Candidatus Aminicenantes bacterium]|nr:MAG: Nramp family divalent metal transporter [Candidatus Aminicenantes bacterium]
MKFLKNLGPGIVVAATGVGAGDMIAASVAGAKYGIVIIWAAIVGAIIKFILNEGIARWQLATGTTVLQGWKHKFHALVSIYFIVYLFLWGFIVAGALIAACGLAAHAIFPFCPVETWGILHSLTALLLVYIGRYQLMENLMKFFIGLMFVVVCLSAILIHTDWGLVLKSLAIPGLPPGSVTFILGVIGGVGGTVTLLSYGYWIREKKWIGKQFYKRARTDLMVAYLLTGLFGMAIIIIAAGVKPEVITGSKMVIGLAEQMGTVVGPIGKWIFLIGFWGAVFSSMLGVWQGVPYLFSDSIQVYKNKSYTISRTKIDLRSRNYLFFLFYLAIPPLILLFFGKPVWVVVIYSIIGAFFMPFLAVLLLIMNNRIKWVKDFKNNLLINLLLFAGLVLFAFLCISEIWQRLF